MSSNIRGRPKMTPVTPPRRRRLDCANFSSPRDSTEDAPGTPGPTKARIANLNSQVQELVRKHHAAERKMRAQESAFEAKLEQRDLQVADMQEKLAAQERRNRRFKEELRRCQSEGTGIREEVDLFSQMQQQKAQLAISEGRLQLIEMERQLAEAEAERVIRDHKLSLLQSKLSDSSVESNRSNARIAELEAALESANTSAAHQRAAQTKHALDSSAALERKVKDLERAIAELRSENEALQTETTDLKATNKSLQQSERAARAELTTAQAAAGGDSKLKSQLRDARADAAKFQEEVEAVKEELEALKKTNKGLKAEEKAARAELAAAQSSMAGGDDKLRTQLREVKVLAAKREEEVEEAREELETLKETNKALKAKYREERVRVAGIEEELEALKSAKPKTVKASTKRADYDSNSDPEPIRKKKAAKASPVKPASKPKARKPTPGSDSDDESPKKRLKKAAPKEKPSKPASSKSRKPLADADVNGDSDDDAKSTKPSSEPEKKKKRKLFGGAQPAFNWDPILSSGDGVIPTFLSPVKSTRAVGTIPRAGFSKSTRTIGLK